MNKEYNKCKTTALNYKPRKIYKANYLHLLTVYESITLVLNKLFLSQFNIDTFYITVLLNTNTLLYTVHTI